MRSAAVSVTAANPPRLVRTQITDRRDVRLGERVDGPRAALPGERGADGRGSDRGALGRRRDDEQDGQAPANEPDRSEAEALLVDPVLFDRATKRLSERSFEDRATAQFVGDDRGCELALQC
jgi:hypothetical protein